MNALWAEPVDSDGLRAAVTASRIETFARRYYALFNDRRLDEAEALVHPEATFHLPRTRRNSSSAGPDIASLARRWEEAFPDADLSIRRDDGHRRHRLYRVALHRHLPGHAPTSPGFPTIPSSARAVQLMMSETIRVTRGLVVDNPLQVRRWRSCAGASVSHSRAPLPFGVMICTHADIDTAGALLFPLLLAAVGSTRTGGCRRPSSSTRESRRNRYASHAPPRSASPETGSLKSAS